MQFLIFLLWLIMSYQPPSTDVVQQIFSFSPLTTQLESNESEEIVSNTLPNLTEEEQDAIAYWNDLAIQYGVQIYSPVNGSLESYIEYMQGVIAEHEQYKAYQEDADGVLIENPIYENRWGPSDEEYYNDEDNIPLDEIPQDWIDTW